jgi:hypothetical protein
MEKPMAKIFISHAEEDEDIAKAITERLKQQAVEVWISRIGVVEDNNSPEKIVQTINWSDKFILFWSQAATESYEVMFEWTNALNLRKTIIPCLLDDTILPESLQQEPPINFENIEEGFQTLLQRLKLDKEKNVHTENSLIKTTSPSQISVSEELVNQQGNETSTQHSTSPSFKVAASEASFERSLPIHTLIDWYKIGSVVAGMVMVILSIFILAILCRNKTIDKLLRSQAGILSEKDIQEIIRVHNFFDVKRNSQSRGVINLFRTQINQADTMIIDDASGLWWQYSDVSFKAMTFEDAHKYVERLNESKYGSFSDWRLPTLDEAMTLLEPVKNELGIYSDFNSGVWQSKILTSDESIHADFIWVLDFSEGYCLEQEKVDSAFVKAVRSM